jgi:hypothetical protein
MSYGRPLIESLALVAIAKALPADTPATTVDALQAAIVDTFRKDFMLREPFVATMRRGVRCAGLTSRRKRRCEHVMDIFAVGLLAARELCEWVTVDPDELIGTYGD